MNVLSEEFGNFFEKVVQSQQRLACSKLTIETWEN